MRHLGARNYDYLSVIIILNLINVLLCNEYKKYKKDLNSINSTSTSSSSNKLKYHDVWYEINESTILNCSLRVNKDQHVVWHRKYDKMGVHVLTIGSETFISDLRIRPIKQQHYNNNNNNLGSEIQSQSSSYVSQSSFENNDAQNYANNIQDDYKVTWNLEIRKLKKEDSALYYCVLNSENSYGQIYKLNVLPQFKFLNKSEIIINNNNNPDNAKQSKSNLKQQQKPVILICKYDDLIINPNDQIKWYFNKHRIRNTPNIESTSSSRSLISDQTNAQTKSDETTFKNLLTPNHHFTIIQTLLYDTNSTISTLLIHNFNSKYNSGKYRCQFKGLIRTIRMHSYNSKDESTNNNRLYKQSVYSLSSSSSSSSSSYSHNFSSMFKILSMILMFYSAIHI